MRMSNLPVQDVILHHELADVKIHFLKTVDSNKLKNLISDALDHYITDNVPAAQVQHSAQQRHGTYYQTPGYFVYLYRKRRDLTQIELAKRLDIKQHHISEMENNRRSIGKVMAKRIAALLDFDYKKLL